MRFDTLPIAPEGRAVTDMEAYSAQFPGAAMEGDALRVHYQKFVNGHDTLETGIWDGEGLTGVEVISGSGEVLYPVSAGFSGGVWYAWSEAKDGIWQVCARFVKDRVWSKIFVVDQGESVLYPNFCVADETLYLFWTRQSRNAAAAMLCRMTESGAKDMEQVSSSSEVYRANGCQGGDGNLYVAYDAYVEGAYHTLARVRTEDGWSREVQLDNSGEWTCSSRVIPAAHGATVCWYSFGYGATFAVCTADISRNEKELAAKPPYTVVSNVGWYMDLFAAGQPDGFQVLTYTWGKDAVQVRYRKEGGKWSEPAMMSYEDVHCAVHPWLLLGEEEDILLAWQFANRNGHYDRNAKVVLTHFTPADIDRRGDSSKEAATNNFTIPIAAEKHLDKHTEAEVEQWLRQNGYAGKLLFGDIHGQSGISDGMGTIDQYYRRSRDRADLQFSCLTDHDCYPDWISQSEWELMRTTARLMNTDNELTCLLSFEWTPNEYQYDFGHKNIYYRDDKGDIFRSGDASGITPTDLYASIKNYRGMCIPHHPAADWGMVSAATDWSFHDDQVERLAEIMSRHAPYEDDACVSKYTKNIKKMKGRSVQAALARGYRMGFTAGSDSHQMEHGVEGGIVAVFTPTHDREGIWDSMYDRRTYGTTGARILVSFKANGHMMGSELNVKKDAAVKLEISVFGTKEVRVDLLRNNCVIQTWEPGSERLEAVLEEKGTGESDCYYVRVTQPDEHMAWSSPIWIDRV